MAGKQVARTCKTCKSTFMAREADVKRGWAKFCSKSCKATYQSKHNPNAFDRGCVHDQDDMHETALYESTAGWDDHKGWF